MSSLSSSTSRKKAIKMIILGFAGPFILIIISTILYGIINAIFGIFGANEIVEVITNIIFLLVGIIAVIGIFSWGPIIGIMGIIQLNKSKGTK